MTVAFAMLADYVVSMSVTPVVLAWLYQAGQRKTAGHEDSADEDGFAMCSRSMNRCYRAACASSRS